MVWLLVGSNQETAVLHSAARGSTMRTMEMSLNPANVISAKLAQCNKVRRHTFVQKAHEPRVS